MGKADRDPFVRLWRSISMHQTIIQVWSWNVNNIKSMELFPRKNFHPSYRCGNEHQAEILKTLWKNSSQFHGEKKCCCQAIKKPFFMSNWNKNLSFFATNHLSYFSIRHRCISNKKLNAYLTSWLTVN